MAGGYSVLLDLEILNGVMSLKFDKYVNTYTVEVDNNVEKLQFNYKVEDEFQVDVINNENINEGLNYVYIIVTNKNEQNTYTLEVYKEVTKKVISTSNLETKLEVEQQVNKNTPYIIGTICFVVILIFFLIIFHPRKSLKKTIEKKYNKC